MSVHPVIAEFLATLPPSDATAPDVAGWRAMGEAHLPPLDARPGVAEIVDRVVPTAQGEVPVRIYRPEAGAAAGVLLYFHGGAFFSGSLETHDVLARTLTGVTGFTVVSVGYRLAPEHAFPAGLVDCDAVLEWVIAEADELGWNGERLAVAGDSSGATFVAAITGMARDRGLGRITDQVLLYPSVDLDFDTERYPSLRENAVGYGLETIALKPHNSFYIESGADPADPLVSPIKRDDLSHLPRALVITAEFDPLRDEGEAYAARLADAGVEVESARVSGATHGFLQHFGGLPEFAPVFERIGAFLNHR